VKDALVILRRSDREKRRAVCENEVRRFLTDEELLEDNAIARAAKPPLDHQRLNRRRCRGPIVDEHHALARGETVGLQHERIPKWVTFNPGQRGRRRVAHVVPRGWY